MSTPQPTIYICQFCDEIIVDKPSTKRRYCSKECSRLGRIGQKLHKENPRSETRLCKQCQRPFTEYLSQPEKFCSQACYSRWQSENLSGPNSYSWQGGAIDYRGPNWEEQADKARLRDGNTCQHCGTDGTALGKSLDVHHLIPFRTFGIERYEEANDLSNLISLCRSCHVRTEKGNLVLQLPLFMMSEVQLLFAKYSFAHP